MHKKVNIGIYVVVFALFLYAVIITIINNNKIKEYSVMINYFESPINVLVYDKKEPKILKNIDEIYKKYSLLFDNIDYINNNEVEEYITIDNDLYNMLETLLKYDYKISDKEIVLKDNQILSNKPNINIDNFKISYVNDIVSNYLKENGYNKFIINGLGNIVLGSEYYSSGSYGVAMQYDASNDVIDVIYLLDKAVASKGAFDNIKTDFLNVSVIADSNLEGSIIANKLYYMSYLDGIEFVKDLDVAVLWVDLDKNIYTTSNYNSFK